jgi:hypothetical protein
MAMMVVPTVGLPAPAVLMLMLVLVLILVPALVLVLVPALTALTPMRPAAQPSHE